MAHRPLLRVVWSDPDSAATGYVVVDRLITGIATGGLRMRAGCALEEVEDLAREMSLKSGTYHLPVGGAKGGIDYPADAPDADRVRERFLAAMRPLLESIWVTAGDLGTPQAALDAAFERLGFGPSSLRAGLLRSTDPAAATTRVQQMFRLVDDGLAMPELIGGYGVAEAGLATLEALGLAVDHSRAVVQGFGAMGGSAALYLHRAGVRVIGIADADGLVHNTARGLDVSALLAGRRPGGLIDRSSLREDDQQAATDGWLDLPCELAVPAATSYAVTESVVDRLLTRAVAEAANVPLTAGAKQRLLDRGIPVIPDFVANAGAVAWAWWSVFGLVSDAESSRRMVSAHVRPLVGRLIEAWTINRLAPRAGATVLAERALAELGERFGYGEERVPLFQAGRLAAQSVTATAIGRS